MPNSPSIATPDLRTPVLINGIKVYPGFYKGGPRWIVQNEANRGTDDVYGDSIHVNLSDAEKETEAQVRRVESGIVGKMAKAILEMREEAKRPAVVTIKWEGRLQDGNGVLSHPAKEEAVQRAGERRGSRPAM